MAADPFSSVIGTTETEQLFDCMKGAHGVGLAVSGGADSVALMRLFAAWRGRRQRELPVRVFTVDHRLRPEAAEEAAAVGQWAAAAGLAHETLVWDGPKPTSGIQEAARKARYRLMCERCAALGLTHLVTAHHLDDQAETVLMRLARGSGLDGLAAMSRQTPLDGPVLIRPLLDVPKARLIATLHALGQPWLDDPSNEDERFARSRLRRLMPRLAEEGLTAERLCAFARKAARARDALEAAAGELHARAVSEDPAGFCRLDPAALACAPQEIGLRVLGRLLAGVGGGEGQPRLDRLERLHAGLAAHGRSAAFRGATLGGCRIVPDNGMVVIFRELARRPPSPVALAPRSSLLWDGRFRVSMADGLPEAQVGPVGADGLAALRRASAFRPVPAAAARASPGVFVAGALHAAPHLEAGHGPYSPPGIEIAFIGGARFAAAGR